MFSFQTFKTVLMTSFNWPLFIFFFGIDDIVLSSRFVCVCNSSLVENLNECLNSFVKISLPLKMAAMEFYLCFLVKLLG